MLRRWVSRLWLALLGVCTVTACASLALTAVARSSDLEERWLVGSGASSVPRLGYTGDGVVQAGLAVPFGGSSKSRQWRWHDTGADLTCSAMSLSDGQYVCDRYTLALAAPFPMVTGACAILPVFAFLNGPFVRFVRRRSGRCAYCGRGEGDDAPPCPRCGGAEETARS